MTIKFVLLVNKQGQTRLAKYFSEFLSTDERRALEGEVVRKCLSRTDKQVWNLDLQGMKHNTVSGVMPTQHNTTHRSVLHSIPF